MGRGTINGLTPPDTFAPTSSNTGTLSASAVYSDGTLYGATAFRDLGTTNNTASVTFTYQGSEAAGGAAVGLRWNDADEEGILAYIDSSGANLVIVEQSTGWVFVQDADTALTLTADSSYTLTLSDDGSTVTATIIDDVGVQTCDITTSLNTANTEFMFGWIGDTASYAFNAVVTYIEATRSATVATPMFSPDAGAYDSTQSVTISTYPPGAAIYYTTNGSTPTSASTLHTGPISVSTSETVKAIGILAGWTDSAVGSAEYLIGCISVSFDGASNQYVLAPIDGSALTAFSLSLWVKRATGGSSGILQWATGLGATHPAVYLRDTGTTLEWYMNADYRITGVALADDTWTHLMLTWDGSDWTAYVDGSSAGTYSGGNSLQGNASDLYLGNGYHGYWSGETLDARVYDAELSSGDVTTIYNSGCPDFADATISGGHLIGWWKMLDGSGTTAPDSSSGGNDGTLYNGVSWVGDCPCP